jgi:hypothetical protein
MSKVADSPGCTVAGVGELAVAARGPAGGDPLGGTPDPRGGRLLIETLCGPSINPYRRCDIRCGYCINASQGASEPVLPAGAVAAALRRELAAVEVATSLGVGTVIDAYPRAEAALGISRTVLATLAELALPFVVVTKSTLVRRDADLLGAGQVVVSLSTLDEGWASRFEPGAPPPAERLRLVHDLAAAGLRVAVSVAPWIPEVTDVAALVARIDPAIAVTVAPLNVSWLATRGRVVGGGRTQAEIDAAYLAELDRLGVPDNVAWLPPPSIVPDQIFEAIAEGPTWHAQTWGSGFGSPAPPH